MLTIGQVAKLKDLSILDAKTISPKVFRIMSESSVNVYADGRENMIVVLPQAGVSLNLA